MAARLLQVALAVAAALVVAALALVPASAQAAIIRSADHGAVGSPPGWVGGVGGGRVVGASPRGTTLHADVALAPRDPAGLAAYARAVSTPGSSLYHRYLTVRQFAERFAPRGAGVAAVRASLVADGLRPGAISANGLALTVTAGAGRMRSALGTSLRLVQGIVGLDSPPPTVPRPRIRHAGRDRAHDVAIGVGPQPCAAARGQAAGDGGYTTSQIAARYHLDDLYAAGVMGSHVTVAVYELEPFDASDVAAFQSCFHTAAAVSTVPVDGGAGSGAGSGEAAMDVEDVIGLAPQANVRVYEGPPTGAGAYDTYARIVSDDAARVVTTSWGLCEADQGASAAEAENTLFQEAAVQGQTILASSGDEGSNDCSDNHPAVDDPASQPWVTGVGASTIRSGADSVWNNSMGATGGGVSQLWARPAYQSASAQVQGATTCGAAGYSCREVPDVTADGDPNTGYVVYYHGRWSTVGGTSVSTPTWAALTALADSSPACAGHPVGFANPILYRLAATAYATDFGDITTGSNGYQSVPGFSAGPGYDMASGLGTPDAASLIPALCGDSLTLDPIVAQRSAVGQAQHVRVSATSSSAAAVSYAASGLPAGLALDAVTGMISGTPTTVGAFSATVTATDVAGASGHDVFDWVVTASAHPPARAAATAAGTPAHDRRTHRHRRRRVRAAPHVTA